MKEILFNDMKWLVLDTCENKTLLLAKEIAEKQPYNDTRFCAAWEESSLHTHLGRQFLLSAEEVSRYLKDSVERIALWKGEPWAWWLRDIGIKNHAAFVAKDGEINAHGYRVDCAWCGVRPAMWMEL